MPIYEYECPACKTRFERSQRFSDPPLTECPECGGAVRRVLFPAGIVFKGSGWYITDSRKAASTASEAGAAATDGAGKAESKPETKPESTTSTKSGGRDGASPTPTASPAKPAKAD